MGVAMSTSAMMLTVEKPLNQLECDKLAFNSIYQVKWTEDGCYFQGDRTATEVAYYVYERKVKVKW